MPRVTMDEAAVRSHSATSGSRSRSGIGRVAAVLGAVASPILGAAAYGAHRQNQANRAAGRELAQQTEIIRGQAAKADLLAKQQQAQAEKAMQKISKGRVKAAHRRVRGGLFGDASSQEQYTVASRLGG